jgi:hypothetical protein
MRVEVGQKLLALYRGAASTPEGQNAARQLTRLLEESGQTLRALDPSYPDSRDARVMLVWRESEGWLARLALDERDAALEFLVDAADLSASEKQQVLQHLDLHTLVRSRLHGWSLEGRTEPELILQALQGITEAELLEEPAPSVSGALRALVLRRAWPLQHPPRSLRAESEWQAAFLAGLVRGVTGREAQIKHDAGQWRVEVGLSADELSKLRTLQAIHQPALPEKLRRAATEFAERVARGVNT